MVYRAFCIPGVDNVAAIDPTYGMYQVCADVNDVEYRKVLLDENYQFSADKLLAATDDHTKLVFLCSPNNQPVITWIVGKWKNCWILFRIGDYRRGLFRFF